MNVTLRPDGCPDVYVTTSGQYLDLAALDKQIRTLLVARRWLKNELARVAAKPKDAKK